MTGGKNFEKSISLVIVAIIFEKNKKFDKQARSHHFLRGRGYTSMCQ